MNIKNQISFLVKLEDIDNKLKNINDKLQINLILKRKISQYHVKHIQLNANL